MPVREPPYRRAWREEGTGAATPSGLYYQTRPAAPPKPVATWWLLGIIFGVFILQSAVRVFLGEPRHHQAFVINTDWYLRPWTLVTSTFAHGGLGHFFFNGLFLYFFGPTVERLLGRTRYVTLFVLSGAVAGVCQAHLQAYFSDAHDPSIGGALGASGALMALFGILVVVMPKAKMIAFPIPVPIPLWVAGLMFVLLDLAGAIDPTNRVGNFAHLAGLAIGAGYGWYLKLDRRRRGVHFGAVP